MIIMWCMTGFSSCTPNNHSDNPWTMEAVQLASASDTISSAELVNEPYRVFIYMPKVGCSSCASNDIRFLESFLYTLNKERTALITHMVNTREQRLLEKQLGIRVYRMMNHREKLFGDNNHNNGMIFTLNKNGDAVNVLPLNYDREEAFRYCKNLRYKL